MSEQPDGVLPVLQRAQKIRFSESYILLTALITAGVAVAFMGCCAFLLITCVTRRLKRTEKARVLPTTRISALSNGPDSVHNIATGTSKRNPGLGTPGLGTPGLGIPGLGTPRRSTPEPTPVQHMAAATASSSPPSFRSSPPLSTAASAGEDRPPQYAESPRAEFTA